MNPPEDSQEGDREPRHPAEKRPDFLRRHDPDQVRGSAVSRTLSAPVALPCRARNTTRMLRLLQEPRTGRPAPLTKLAAILVLVTMVGAAAPFVVDVLAWVLGLL